MIQGKVRTENDCWDDRDAIREPAEHTVVGRNPGSKSFVRKALRYGISLLAILTAIVVMVIGCLGGDRELFQDESHGIWLNRSGWGHIAEFIRFDPSAPLYHYVTKLWIDLGGESEVWFRFESGLCYLAAFPVIWWLGRPTFSRSERFGIFVLLIACKTVGFDAIFGRFYEMMFLESCVILLSFVGLFGGRLPRRTALTLLTLGNFAGLMTHYYFMFCLLAQGVAYLLFFRWRRFGDFLVGAVVPVIAFAVVWGPTFRAQLASGRFNDDRSPLALSVLLGDTYFARRWLIILPALLLLTLVEHRRARWCLISWGRFKAKTARFLADERTRVFAVLWGVTFLSPFLTSMFLGAQFLKRDPYIMLTSLPFVALLILAVDRSDRLLRVVLGLVIVCFVGTIEARFRTSIVRNGFPRNGTRAAVETMLGKGQSGDIVVCLDNYFTKIDYYVRRSPTGVRAEVLGFPKDLEKHPGWSDWRILRDMEAFKAYARGYAAEVARTAERRPGCHVWVLDAEWVPDFTSVAMAAFDAAMKRTERIEVPEGVGFTEIVGYEPRRAKPEDASQAGGGPGRPRRASLPASRFPLRAAPGVAPGPFPRSGLGHAGWIDASRTPCSAPSNARGGHGTWPSSGSCSTPGRGSRSCAP